MTIAVRTPQPPQRPVTSHPTARGAARLGAAGAVIALCALLAACASGGGSSTTGDGATATTGAGASPTATTSPSATAAPTATPLPTAFHVSPADTAGLCNGSFGPNAPSVYAFSHTVYAEAAFALSYPSYAMPSSAGFKPFKLGNSIDSPVLDQIFGGPPNANPAISQPGGILFSVCNNGSQSITVSGMGMAIMRDAPHSSPIDTWQLCDGAYQPGVGVTGGGCGGAVLADEDMRATFPASASAGAATSATMMSANGPNGYGPLPVTLKPGHTLQITVAVTMPTTPGVYTLALTVKATGVSGPAAYAPLTPQLFAATSHKWNGQNCKASSMLSQIPANATSSYFICPA
jgi:hypothetical protein